MSTNEYKFSCVYMFSHGYFNITLACPSWIWPTKSKIFTIWPFAEKATTLTLM